MPMPPIEFHVAMFRGEWDQARSQYVLLFLMEALCRVNQSLLRQNRVMIEKGMIGPDEKIPELYRAGIHYEREQPGQEEWPDIVHMLKKSGQEFTGPWADCIPLTSKILLADHTVGTFGSLKVGDRIVGDGTFTTVTAFAVTGMKPILNICLSNDRLPLRCSPEHRVFAASGSEVRAENIRVGDLLRSSAGSNRVISIIEGPPEICGDITTDTGRFYLPESDTIVHNCEDLACWRVAELRELAEHIDPTTGKKKKGGMKARPFAKWRRGPSGAFHYHALVLLPDGKIEDPSLVLGMGKERIFAERDIAERLKRHELDPKIQYAVPPEVMVADIESPTGFNDRKRDPKGVIGVPKRAAEFAIRDPLLESLMGALGPVCGMAGPAVVDDAQPTIESLRAAAPDPISAATSLLGGPDPMAAAASLLGADPMTAAAASMPESTWAPAGPDAPVTESSIAPLRADVAQISAKVNPPPESFAKGLVKRTARTEIQHVLQRALEVLFSRF